MQKYSEIRLTRNVVYLTQTTELVGDIDWSQKITTNFTYKLQGDHEDRFQWESAVTKVKQLLEARTEQLQHQYIVLAAPTKRVYARHTICRDTQITLVLVTNATYAAESCTQLHQLYKPATSYTSCSVHVVSWPPGGSVAKSHQGVWLSPLG